MRALTHDDGSVSGAIAAVADVTDSVRLREELTRRATFDDLTGCYARAAILAELQQPLHGGRRRVQRAVIFIDLDNFKRINDEQGHAAGDDILRAIGSALRSVVRENDLVGRVGGDEFLIVCPGIDGPDTAMDLAERLVDSARAAFCRETGKIGPQLSAGVAWSADEDIGADALVAAADAAMYESKRERAGRPKLATLR
jgi:diguanylate cyclase (GGDEF)-like protein